VPAELYRHGLDGLAELVELDGEPGDGEGLRAVLAMLFHDGVKVLSAMEGGPSIPALAATASERDRLAGSCEVDAGLFDTAPGARRSSA